MLTAASLFSWKHGGRQEFLLLDFSGKAPFVFVRFASKCNRLAACFNLLYQVDFWCNGRWTGLHGHWEWQEAMVHDVHA